jgi:hypothetical protein
MLCLLITVDGVSEVVGKVIPQGQMIADHIGIGGPLSVTDRIVILSRETGSPRPPTVGRIERSEAGDQPFRHGAHR